MKGFVRRLAVLLVVLGLGVSIIPAPTEAVIITSSNGLLSASVSFTVDASNNLVVTLTNTSAADVLVPSEVLTAVFFDLAGVGALTPISAVLTGGSVVLYDAQPAGGNVGGEWGYASGLAGAPLGATEGISSTGLGLFGQPNFNGPNLAPPDALDGLQYGIVSAGDDDATGNGGITGSGGLIKNSVTFTLSGLPSGYSLTDSSISNVFFQYGTSLEVPAPATITLVGLGLLGAAAIGRLRRFRRKK